MKNFITRALTGILFAAILVGSVLNQYTFLTLFLLIGVLATREYFVLAQRITGRCLNTIGGIFLTIVLIAGTFWAKQPGLYHNFHMLASIYGLVLIIFLVYELFRNNGISFQNWAYFIMGQLIIALPFASLNLLTFRGQGYSWHYLMALLWVIWINDTFAYLCGVTMGKHRFFERISPKKSWEGFIGGALITILICMNIFPYIFEQLGITRQLTQQQWVGFVIVAIIGGTFGDLIESQLKRSVDAKDSGHLLPGHGGILDRFDSLMLATPCVLIYLHFVQRFFCS